MTVPATAQSCKPFGHFSSTLGWVVEAHRVREIVHITLDYIFSKVVPLQSKQIG